MCTLFDVINKKRMLIWGKTVAKSVSLKNEDVKSLPYKSDHFALKSVQEQKSIISPIWYGNRVQNCQCEQRWDCWLAFREKNDIDFAETVGQYFHPQVFGRWLVFTSSSCMAIAKTFTVQFTINTCHLTKRHYYLFNSRAKNALQPNRCALDRQSGF